MRLRIAALAATALLVGCGSKKETKRPPPLVVAAAPVSHLFVDRIEAVGTARANEQVTMAAAVTERIDRLLFDDGMHVTRGQLLAVLSQGQEQAALAGALASEQQARSQLARVQSLSARGFATRTSLDQQLAAEQGARAAAAEARAQIADRMIRAPFAGVTSTRTISEGAIVTSGTPLVTISDLSRIKLDFTIPETRLGALKIGQTIEATSAAFPDQPYTGHIATIDPVLDPGTRAVLVRAILPNPGARIRPGMLMTVRVQTEAHQALAVPELAVTGDGEDRFVFVVKDGKAKRQPVKTGLRDGGLIEVSGVAPSARVIGEGVVKVADGMKVKLDGPPGKHGGKRAPKAAE